MAVPSNVTNKDAEFKSERRVGVDTTKGNFKVGLFGKEKGEYFSYFIDIAFGKVNWNFKSELKNRTQAGGTEDASL